MLNVYAAEWCPHCRNTVAWLKAHGVEFQYHNIDEIDAEDGKLIRKIININGGDDWVVPTLEFNGQWRPGRVFDAEELESYLKSSGAM